MAFIMVQCFAPCLWMATPYAVEITGGQNSGEAQVARWIFLSRRAFGWRSSVSTDRPRISSKWSAAVCQAHKGGPFDPGNRAACARGLRRLAAIAQSNRRYERGFVARNV